MRTWDVLVGWVSVRADLNGRTGGGAHQLETFARRWMTEHHVGRCKVPVDDVRLVHLRDFRPDHAHECIYNIHSGESRSRVTRTGRSLALRDAVLLQRVLFWFQGNILIKFVRGVFDDLLLAFGAAPKEEPHALAVDPLDSEYTFGCVYHAYPRDVHAGAVRWHKLSITRVRKGMGMPMRTGDIG